MKHNILSSINHQNKGKGHIMLPRLLVDWNLGNALEISKGQLKKIKEEKKSRKKYENRSKEQLQIYKKGVFKTTDQTLKDEIGN